MSGLAIGGLGMVLIQAPAPAQGPLALTMPTQASKGNEDPGRLYSSPALRVDPTNPLRVIAGFADLRTRQCGLLRSLDGGNTWTRSGASPGTVSYPFCAQAQGGVIQAPVAFGGGGMIYMALGGWGSEDTSRDGGGVMVARSANMGDSWDTVVVRTTRGLTGDAVENLRPVQSLAVASRNGKDDIVYLTFARSLPKLAPPNAAPVLPMVAVSHDGGRTFAEPVNLADKVFDSQAIRDQALNAVTTTTAPPTTTSAIRNDRRAADSRSKSSKRPALIVMPDRDTPGWSASVWARPMMAASRGPNGLGGPSSFRVAGRLSA